jgi:hypothetical protein
MKARLVLIAVVLALWPTQAHAARGFWAWLEELSGPGPFYGPPMVSLTVACFDSDYALEPCARDFDRERPTLVFRVGKLHTDDTPRFADLPADDPDNRGEVRVIPVSVGVMYHPHPALSLGPSAGFMRFSGEGFSPFYKLTLTPMSMAVTPFAFGDWKNERLARVLRFELDTSFVPQGFKGSDFDNPRTRFDSGAEFLTRFATVIDLGELVWGRPWSR